MAMVHCRGCGKQIHETAPSCPHCGAPQLGVAGASLKTQTVAGLWCAFLGGFGAHRFYLGKYVTAVLYLLFFWTAIPGLLACIDLLIIAFSDRNRWAAKYNNGAPTPPVHWIVKVLAVLAPILFFVGIVAAIALPAYGDYLQRARSMQGTALSEPVREEAKPEAPNLNDFEPVERAANGAFGSSYEGAIERYEFVLKHGTALDQCLHATTIVEMAADAGDGVMHDRWYGVAMAHCESASKSPVTS